jgi:hypothetical protein
MSPGEEPATAIVPADGQPAAAAGASSEEPIRCGRWKLLRPDGPLSLRDFLMRPDPSVVEELKSLDPEGLQQLVLARLAGAPPDMRLSLFGEPGYTIRDVVRHVQDGTPLGVRVIDAERKLVGLLLTEALTNASGFPAADLEEASRPVRSARREPSP